MHHPVILMLCDILQISEDRVLVDSLVMIILDGAGAVLLGLEGIAMVEHQLAAIGRENDFPLAVRGMYANEPVVKEERNRVPLAVVDKGLAFLLVPLCEGTAMAATPISLTIGFFQRFE